MLGQLARNRDAVPDLADRQGTRAGAELLLQPRFRLADRAIVALQASTIRSGAALNRSRLPPPAREARDIGRNAALLRHACRIAAECSDPAALSLSLHVTAAQAASGMLAGLIGELLGTCALPPERLELDFCEESLQGDEADLLYTLAALRDIGVGLVLGGFGGGVSSLTLLRRRSLAGLLSGLRLDALLLHEPDTEQDNGFLHGLIASAHALGLLVFGGGIETERQYRRLCEAGCDQGLGGWLGAARPASEARDWIVACGAGGRGVAP